MMTKWNLSQTSARSQTRAKATATCAGTDRMGSANQCTFSVAVCEMLDE